MHFVLPRIDVKHNKKKNKNIAKDGISTKFCAR